MIDNIRDNFKNFKAYINGWEEMKRASVIIPLVEQDNKVYVLFEMRAKHMKSQPGEISFPGGKIDRGEFPKEAAIREMCEELGIRSKDFDIITSLDLFTTHYNLLIHPFVAEVKENHALNINKDEVDHIFRVPLDFLLDNEPLRIDNEIYVSRNKEFPFHMIPNGENYKFKKGVYPTIFYKYNDYVIWGITAKILENFISIYKKLNSKYKV